MYRVSSRGSPVHTIRGTPAPPPPPPKVGKESVKSTGSTGYLLWRSIYLSKQVYRRALFPQGGCFLRWLCWSRTTLTHRVSVEHIFV